MSVKVRERSTQIGNDQYMTLAGAYTDLVPILAVAVHRPGCNLGSGVHRPCFCSIKYKWSKFLVIFSTQYLGFFLLNAWLLRTYVLLYLTKKNSVTSGLRDSMTPGLRDSETPKF